MIFVSVLFLSVLLVSFVVISEDGWCGDGICGITESVANCFIDCRTGNSCYSCADICGYNQLEPASVFLEDAPSQGQQTGLPSAEVSVGPEEMEYISDYQETADDSPDIAERRT
ncbi:hypothetical protein KY366_07645 [Candidatus Woesearchaeota archaeon]|nr:hypothetical protein [Candidatus Woesearchaeota archaeon]